MMAQILQPLNETAGHRQAPIFTFNQYRGKRVPSRVSQEVEGVHEEHVGAGHHAVLDSGLWQPTAGYITRNQMQKFLDEKSVHLSSSVVGHLRWHLNAINKMAQSDGVVEFNPAAALFTPACKAPPLKRVMWKDEVRVALSILDIRTGCVRPTRQPIVFSTPRRYKKLRQKTD
jgi:hypothetical protein